MGGTVRSEQKKKRGGKKQIMEGKKCKASLEELKERR